MEGTALLATALVAIGLLTLTPTGADEARKVCIICGPHAGADVILNIALFLPVGAALALLGTRWRMALAISIGVSVVVELLQLALPIGRVASISDLTFNAVGAVVGLQLTRRRRAILYPRSRNALKLAIGGGAVWLLVLLITALLLRPSLPGGRYFGQWRPILGEDAAPAGRVVSASAAGIPVPEGPYPQTDSIRRALRDRMQVDLLAEFSAPGSGELAGILRLVSDTEGEIMLVGQRGNDLLFRARVLATDLRLVTPSVMMFNAVQGIDLAQPRRLPIEGRRDRGILRMTVYGTEAAVRLHSGAGWMLIVPPTHPLMHAPALMSAMWIGAPLFLIGYWTGRRARRKARRAGDAFRLTGTGGEVLAAIPVLVGLVVIGLAGISALFGLAVPGQAVWAGAAIGLGIGMLGGITTALSHDSRAQALSMTPAHST